MSHNNSNLKSEKAKKNESAKAVSELKIQKKATE